MIRIFLSLFFSSIFLSSWYGTLIIRFWSRYNKSFSKYRKVVEAGGRWNLAVDEGYVSSAFWMGSALYFSAKLDENRNLTLLRVENVADSRIFRKFGCHRFVHILIQYYGSLLIPPYLYFNILKYLFQYFKLIETKLNITIITKDENLFSNLNN